ncbi:MAG: peptidase domain protein [Gemmatimonadetes bacterium]|nr:peptidase domain protein [Gemmatimonadota bacterium]
MATFALLPLPVPVAAQVAPPTRPLAYTRAVLGNGLVVLLNEDHSSPVVAVEMLYRLGSKDEPAGKTGLAHLCEHLMGEGSPNVTMTKQLLLSVGGSSTSPTASWAATDEDRTHYFYTVPANQLETALWAESDRMAAPLTFANDEHLKSVREIVRQERAQNRDGRTFGDAERLTLDQFFVGQTRYPRDALGPMADLDRTSAADAKQFCLPYYVPNNAVLALSGDFKTADAQKLVAKYFGSIARGVVPAHPAVAPTPLTAERRVVLEDTRARVPVLRLAWFTAGFSQPDRLALNALAAMLAPTDPRMRQLLPGADRAGRLSKLLVYDRQLATSVSAGNFDMETGGIFQIEVTPRANAPMGQIETLVDSVLTDLKAGVIADAELAPYREATTVIGVTTLQTRGARADTLAQGEAFAGDPVAYAKQAARTLRLSPADVRAAAQKYLTNERVVMSLIPAGKLDLISKPTLPYTNVTPAKAQVVP